MEVCEGLPKLAGIVRSSSARHRLHAGLAVCEKALEVSLGLVSVLFTHAGLPFGPVRPERLETEIGRAGGRRGQSLVDLPGMGLRVRERGRRLGKTSDR